MFGHRRSNFPASDGLCGASFKREIHWWRDISFVRLSMSQFRLLLLLLVCCWKNNRHSFKSFKQVRGDFLPQCRRWPLWWGKCCLGRRAHRHPFAQCSAPHPDVQSLCPDWHCRSLQEDKASCYDNLKALTQQTPPESILWRSRW